ncbi:hypothetical protein EYF80_028962 [Liparis tanakae]|uniref:Secreted protein n=1 Tax=Liparis tanakae TaxID=230148 RepID=A0A4Z2H7J9_9TELE|nr:hypothetical protein EYF80_028962 [Liparis tanakae]
MCEFLCSSSVVLGRWLLWRAAMAASRNQAAFSGVGARSSDWFWSWRTCEWRKVYHAPQFSAVLGFFSIMRAGGDRQIKKTDTHARRSWSACTRVRVTQFGVSEAEDAAIGSVHHRLDHLCNRPRTHLRLATGRRKG